MVHQAAAGRGAGGVGGPSGRGAAAARVLPRQRPGAVAGAAAAAELHLQAGDAAGGQPLCLPGDRSGLDGKWINGYSIIF